MRSPLRPLLPALFAVAALATGCGGSSPSGPAGAAASPVTITAGDTSCGVGATALPAGKNELTVKNTGAQTTEVYVYGKNAAGDYAAVLGEIENVGPGLSRKLSVTLTGQDVEFACKPGQKGDGIRARVPVTGGTAAGSSAKYDREVLITAADFSLNGAPLTARVGERIEFKLANNGGTDHEFEVLDASGTNIGEVGPTAPGKTGEVIITFAKAGTYSFLCGIGDHAGKGMKGTITVS